MSCSQVVAEFSREKFRLVFHYPAAFGNWRYTCLSYGRNFYIYRVLFASLLLLLVILDFFWIIGFAGAGENNRISACLDSSQFALVLAVLTYFLLSCLAFRWSRVLLEPNADKLLPYKPVWLLYTCTVNAVYASMILFWMSVGPSSTIEQQLKNSIPGILILGDLCLSSIPLYLCHAIYVMLFYLLYLVSAGLTMFVIYTSGMASKQGPTNPTVWIGGRPLLPNGYRDFTDLHYVLPTLIGSLALAIMVHCILLSIVIARDFAASLFHHSTQQSLLFGAQGDLYSSTSTEPNIPTDPKSPSQPVAKKE